MKKKMFVCDVEGTIFKAKYRIKGTEYASTIWQSIAKCLGEAAIQEEKETQKKWKNGRYATYKEWVEDTVAIHIRYKLHKDKFKELIDKAEYEDGVIEFFQNIDRRRFIPVLVSGGFQELVEKAKCDLKIDYGFGACEYIFNNSYLDKFNYTDCDFEGKFDCLEDLFLKFKITNKELIFVGDGKNDIDIAEKAALPFAFGIHAHEELRKKVKPEHNIKSFSEIPALIRTWEQQLSAG